MNRREAIYRAAILLGGTIISPQVFLTACRGNSDIEDDDKTTEIFNEIAGVVIPKTDTPSAKEANVAPEALVILRDCYSEEHQKLFKTGLNTINQMAVDAYGNDFIKISETEQKTVIKKIDLEERAYKQSENPHYFRLLKELIVLSFFTSEIGCTEALRYLPVPGKFIGDFPYQKGDKAWATS